MKESFFLMSQFFSYWVSMNEQTGKALLIDLQEHLLSRLICYLVSTFLSDISIKIGKKTVYYLQSLKRLNVFDIIAGKASIPISTIFKPATLQLK